VVVIQPVGKVNVMVTVPGVTPRTVPVEDPTTATPVLLLLHDPTVAGSLSVAADNGHTFTAPDIAGGKGFTVTGKMAIQPVDNK
jgi:hypothetical protein